MEAEDMVKVCRASGSIVTSSSFESRRLGEGPACRMGGGWDV